MSSTAERVWIARQPLFDRERKVVAYELLFRPHHTAADGTVTVPDKVWIDDRNAGLIHEAIQSVGLGKLTRGRPTFVKADRSALLAGLPAALPPDQVVIELPAGIDASAEVRDACADLRRQGFQVALENFVPGQTDPSLLRYADYLKAEPASIALVVNRPVAEIRPSQPPVVIADQVATAEEFALAAALGCGAFQGGFIARPMMRTNRVIPGNRMVYLRLLSALQNPELSVHDLEDLIKPDASLVYRVLRAVNSAAFGQSRQIESLRQALVLLGCGTIRSWASLWAMVAVSGEAPDELVTMSTVRGRACEILANVTWSGAFHDGFLLGVCSLFDAILEVPMAEILSQLPLPDETAAALAGENNHSRLLLDAVIAHEHGDWMKSAELSAAAGVDAAAVPRAYQQALEWQHQFNIVGVAKAA
jgi:EAL and modified HD-GYP domain-containing signal transduction protein